MKLDTKHLYNNLVPCFLGLSFLTYLPINSSLFLHSLEVRLYFSLTLKIYLRLPILDANRHFLVLMIMFLYGALSRLMERRGQSFLFCQLFRIAYLQETKLSLEMRKVFLSNVNKRYKMMAMKTKTYFQYIFLKKCINGSVY